MKVADIQPGASIRSFGGTISRAISVKDGIMTGSSNGIIFVMSVNYITENYKLVRGAAAALARKERDGTL